MNVRHLPIGMDVAGAKTSGDGDIPKPTKEWVFQEPFPSKHQVLNKTMSTRWPASFEVSFLVRNLRLGKQWSRILRIGDAVSLFTNGGPKGDVKWGSLCFFVSGRKFGVAAGEIKDGDKVHIVLTFDGNGGGKMWKNGQLIASKAGTGGGSDPDAPIMQIENCPLSILQDEGCMEVQKLRIYEGLVLEEVHVKELHAQNEKSGGTKLPPIAPKGTREPAKERLPLKWEPSLLFGKNATGMEDNEWNATETMHIEPHNGELFASFGTFKNTTIAKGKPFRSFVARLASPGGPFFCSDMNRKGSLLKPSCCMVLIGLWESRLTASS